MARAAAAFGFLVLALCAVAPAQAWPMWGAGTMGPMRWGAAGRRGDMPMMTGCKAMREGDTVVLKGLKFRGGQLTAAQLPRHPETWQEAQAMMAGLMGDSEEARSMRLECQKQMDEVSGEMRLRMMTPAGCRAGRVAVWCERCMMNGQQVTQMLSSRTLGVPEGRAADGTALVVVLKGAVLEE